MKALTVRQPWASLIVAGLKDVENRSWRAPEWIVGERIAIHSAARRDTPERAAHAAVLAGEVVAGGHFLALDAQAAHACGVVLGSVEVVGCHHADDCAEDETSHFPLHVGSTPDRTVWRKRYCARWAEPDAFHWVIAGPKVWQPVALTGRQGLWGLPAEAVPA